MSSYSGILHHRPTREQTPVTVLPGHGALFIRSDSQTWEWTAPQLTSARRAPDGSVILQNGPFYLEVLDPAFAAEAERVFGGKKLFSRSFFDKIGVAGCLVALLFFLLPILFAFFFLAPKLADHAALEVSPEIEKQIGDSWYQSLTSTYEIDPDRTRLVQQFYDSLAYGGVYDMRITVVHEPVVNAFAVPGGHIVVFDSIIGLMDAPEQLAALLAHEASHVQLKHSTRAIFRELANSLVISLLLGDYGDLSGIVARHGGELLGLSYSRDLELEADNYGLELMQVSRIPLRGMPDLFRKMNHAAGSAAEVPTFLSTHPALDERIRAVEAKIAAGLSSDQEVPEVLNGLWRQIKK